MTKITYTVDIIKRHGGYCVDTCIDGQPVSSLGPLDTRSLAEAVQSMQVTAVQTTIEQHLSQLQGHLQQQRRAVR